MELEKKCEKILQIREAKDLQAQRVLKDREDVIKEKHLKELLKKQEQEET